MKKILCLALGLILVLSLAACSSNKDYIGEEKARLSAIKHAGLSLQDVSFVKTELDVDGGKSVYEVDFRHDGTEYEYEIDAKTGDVVSFDYDGKAPKVVEPDQKEVPSSQALQGEAEITEEEALAIALSEVPGATKNDALIKKDYDDKRAHYDVEISYDGKEYDFEIDAQTGAITERDVESVYD